MNKFSFIFLVFAALATVGCSKHVAVEKPSSENAWIYDESLPVPIQFGVSDISVKVRSPFNDLNDLVGEKFGIIAMDVEKEEVLLKGETATCIYDAVKDKKMLQFEKEKYYPYTSENNFSFFAYYKGNNQNVPVFENDRVKLTIDGDDWGHQDVLWARSDAERLYVRYSSSMGRYIQIQNTSNAEAYYDGFNAAYIRYLAKGKPEQYAQSDWYTHTYENHMPKLSFEHASTNMRFMAVLDSESLTAFDSTPVIKSVTISGDDIHTGADLIVVDKAGGQEGYLDVSNYPKGSLSLFDEEVSIVPTEAGELLGDGLFIQPLKKGSHLFLTVAIEHNSQVKELKVSMVNPKDLKPGHYYTFELRLYKTTGVEIAVADVAPWVEGWDPSDNPSTIVSVDKPTDVSGGNTSDL